MNRRLTIGACTIALAAGTIVPGVTAIGSASPGQVSSVRPVETLLNSVPKLVRTRELTGQARQVTQRYGAALQRVL